MPYRLQPRRPLSEEIRRIVREEIDSAVKQLSHPAAKQRHTQIHEARKSIKKIRGVLKLVRPLLGSVYRKENSAFQKAGQHLSELRDAGAILDTFAAVREKYPGPLKPWVADKLQQALEQRKQQKEQGDEARAVMQHARSLLDTAAARLQGWPLSADSFDAIAPGLLETYRQGRKALKRASRKGHVYDFHEFRKRAKDHWYHMRLLGSLQSKLIETREKDLHELETWLGEDHNLFVLCEQMSADPKSYGSRTAVAAFEKVASKEQRDLRAKALSAGQHIYADKPGAFLREVEKIWDHPPRAKARKAASKKNSVRPRKRES